MRNIVLSFQEPNTNCRNKPDEEKIRVYEPQEAFPENGRFWFSSLYLYQKSDNQFEWLYLD